MRSIIFYILKWLAFISRIFGSKPYMALIITAHKWRGVKFKGKPEYIDIKTYLDPSGGLTLEKGVVISTNTIILTHDWSFLKRVDHQNHNINYAFKPVEIKENSFIGAGAIVLPGSIIGINCIIGAGAVVKGIIPDYSIVVGNPGIIKGTTKTIS